MSDPCATPLAVRRRGSGRPILLLHGLGASARYWARVIARLPRSTTRAPDLLGFGRSPAPETAPYGVACHVTALSPLVVPGTVVVGHSTGAIIAAAVAATHPHLVAGLVLVGLAAFPDAATARAEIGRLGLLARLTVEGRPSARLLCEVMCHVRPLAIAAAPLVVRDMPRAVAADAARHTWRSYSRTLERVVVEHRVEDDLSSVGVPVQLIHGDADRTAPLSEVEAMAARVDQRGVRCRLTVVAGDHHLPVRRPDVVADGVSGFRP